MFFYPVYRPSGEADVAFYSHDDAQASMSKNGQHVGSRYVELFLRSQAGDRFGGGGYGKSHLINLNYT